ncbi:MAG TPA: iron-containing alcohol dehydrogenase, partial [Bryobacteraceae bacterium]|nr:iron-containing alcohol dehydrogenase [Bryobacteraceae bacterium]
WFADFGANPDSNSAERGRALAADTGIDSIIALGGGSSLDCAKAINFLLTNGGSIRDYRGYGKARKPMLPMIGIPTTAGTGSEAQSYAVISDAETKTKMACGDPKAAFAVTILDPELTRTVPASVRAASGFDAIAHAVETLVTTRRNSLSLSFTRGAWKRLPHSFMKTDDQSLEEMQVGAYLAGLAIENSMLGAAHACANPLTKNYGIVHGPALAVLLPHVVRWNACREYSEFHPDLAAFLRELASDAGLPSSLSELGVPKEDLPRLSKEASEQWTGRFNPRPLNAMEIYECAW